ncbi:MAG: DUF2871 family protein [Caldilineaceae bacterium]|nr:DUF2871 family protein [Caldilineaceae bacterium]MBP8108497.1 DUF2871 family protein [Caldilineaceae bacterium]MBP8123331.1 DUF2871 family protein [Caldilineaceae bacterium]MBP9072443.1 DUF2871 family protein [Caldilineaceae bacterium]
MKLNKTIITYSLSTIGLYLFARIYALFGHGVTSPWMSNAYLYALGLGVVVFVLLKMLIPEIVQQKGYRVFYQTYNSGIAILINGMLLHGILDIAGGASDYVSWFLFVGWGLIGIGVVLFFMYNGPRQLVHLARDRKSTVRHTRAGKDALDRNLA